SADPIECPPRPDLPASIECPAPHQAPVEAKEPPVAVHLAAQIEAGQLHDAVRVTLDVRRDVVHHHARKYPPRLSRRSSGGSPAPWRRANPGDGGSQRCEPLTHGATRH